MEDYSDFKSFILHGNTEHGEKEFYCTPDNTELYLHSEQYRDVDHIFHRIDDKDRRLGAFVWRHVLGEDVFEQHADAMCISENWIVHYRPEPTETDIVQYAIDVTHIPDSLPYDFQ